MAWNGEQAMDALPSGPFGMLAAGLWGGQSDASAQRNRLAEYERATAGRPIRELGPANLAGNSGYEANRAAMIAQLEAMARGQGPSVAQNQMREAMDRSTGAQTGMAQGAAGRGMSAGAAFRTAGNNMAAIQTQGARDTTNARVMEQQGALNQLSGAVGTAVGQQNQQAQFNAGQQNQMQVAQLDADLRQQGMNDANRLAILQMYQQNIRPSLGARLGAVGVAGLSMAAGAAGGPGAGQAAGAAGQGFQGGGQ